ncbi:MAG: branched-chain amino acid transporter AzlD [Clostridiales bacterium]|nr:branched-chain amino acid transporter AzlD [Clostridiales bacterium]
MTASPAFAAASILVMAGVTFLTRLIPFLVFGRGGRPPKTVVYLGQALPPAIIAMLVVYCLRNVDLFAGSHGLPELLCAAVVAVLQMWKGKALLSVCGGTLLYMFLVQFVF